MKEVQPSLLSYSSCRRHCGGEARLLPINCGGSAFHSCGFQFLSCVRESVGTLPLRVLNRVVGPRCLRPRQGRPQGRVGLHQSESREDSRTPALKTSFQSILLGISALLKFIPRKLMQGCFSFRFHVGCAADFAVFRCRHPFSSRAVSICVFSVLPLFECFWIYQ